MSLEVDGFLIWGYNTYMNTKEHTMVYDYEDEPYYIVTGCDEEEYQPPEDWVEDDGQPDEAQEWESFDPDC